MVPKTLQRVLRLQRLLALACRRPERPALAALAAAAGYADQAHMTRELGALAERTPGALLGDAHGHASMSDLFKTALDATPRLPRDRTIDPRRIAMEQRLSLVTLGVADLERARRFYEEGLGWRRGNAHAEVVFFQIGGAVLALWSRHALAADARLPDCRGRLRRHSARLQHALARARSTGCWPRPKAAGATILKPAEDAFWGGYSGYFADPDGHPWEVAWNPEWTLLEDGSVRLGSSPSARAGSLTSVWARSAGRAFLAARCGSPAAVFGGRLGAGGAAGSEDVRRLSR